MSLKTMSPKKLIEEAKNYPDERIILTGRELLGVIGWVCDEVEDDLEANAAKILRTLETFRRLK